MPCAITLKNLSPLSLRFVLNSRENTKYVVKDCVQMLTVKNLKNHPS